MNVYLVEFMPDYERGYTVGVYSTREIAERVVEEKQPDFYYCQPCISEFEVDKEPE